MLWLEDHLFLETGQPLARTPSVPAYWSPGGGPGIGNHWKQNSRGIPVPRAPGPAPQSSAPMCPSRSPWNAGPARRSSSTSPCQCHPHGPARGSASCPLQTHIMPGNVSLLLLQIHISPGNVSLPLLQTKFHQEVSHSTPAFSAKTHPARKCRTASTIVKISPGSVSLPVLQTNYIPGSV